MSEQAPNEAHPLDQIELNGRTLQEWHNWLSHDEADLDIGDSVVPCSRYGRNGDECSWWAIACEVAHVEATGENHRTEDALDYYVSLAVNDHDDVLELVRDYWYAIPEALRPYLDYEEGGLNMAQQAKLWSLTVRYGVEYDPAHYLVHPLDSSMMPGWAEGYLGGKPGTLYVGISPEGEAHS